MPRNQPSVARTCAVLIAVLALFAAVPPAALADEENLWTRWADEVADRDTWEVPFAVIFSLPAMLVTTPFYWVGLALDAMESDDE